MFKSFFTEEKLDNAEKEKLELKRDPLISDLIPYERILDDNETILCRNSILSKVIKLKGFDSSSASFSIISGLALERKNTLNNLNSDFYLTFFTCKNKFDLKLNENSKIEILDNINDLRNEIFKENFVINLYAIVNKKFHFTEKEVEEHKIEVNKACNEFKDDVERIQSNLSSFEPHILKNTKEKDFALTKFLCYAFNNVHLPTSSNIALYRHLAISDIDFNYKNGIITLNENRFCQVLNINIDLKNSSEGIFKSILSLDLEFDVMQNTSMIDKVDIMKLIKERQGRNKALSRTIASNIRGEELMIAKELIENELLNMFSSSFFVRVYADNTKSLEKNVAIIRNRFSNFGINAIIETINCKFAYLSYLNENKTTDRRKVPLSSENLSDFITLFNSNQGFSKNSFGNFPITRFKNSSNLIYNFNFHKDDSEGALGHTFIIGGTGAGKSTLVSFLLAQCLKYENMKILAFDNKKGLKIPVKILNGNYSDVANPKEVSLNPLSLKSSLVNRQFLVKFLSMLVGGVDLNEEAVLDEVIRQNYDTLEANDIQGTISKLQSVFGVKKQLADKPSLAKRIEKWIEDVDLSLYFNNENDNLSFDKKINAFDMDGILENDTILAPVSSYIFHRFSELIEEYRTDPKIILIDEFQRFDNSKYFSENIRVALKQYRKKNAVFIGCIQEPSVILKSETIRKDEYLSNIATFIIFPDNKAEYKDYEALGLNDNEFHFIKNTTNDSGSRRVLIKQTNGKSAIVDVNLSSLKNYLKVFSSSSRDLELFEKLESEGSANYINEYLNYEK